MLSHSGTQIQGRACNEWSPIDASFHALYAVDLLVWYSTRRHYRNQRPESGRALHKLLMQIYGCLTYRVAMVSNVLYYCTKIVSSSPVADQIALPVFSVLINTKSIVDNFVLTPNEADVTVVPHVTPTINVPLGVRCFDFPRERESFRRRIGFTRAYPRHATLMSPYSRRYIALVAVRVTTPMSRRS